MAKPDKIQSQFEYITQLIVTARQKAYQAVNQELIQLYWQVGQYVSEQVAQADWGNATVQQLTDYIKAKHPEIKGFSRRSLLRMRQFYETYYNDTNVLPLVTQISWTHHIYILSKTKTTEEREF